MCTNTKPCIAFFSIVDCLDKDRSRIATCHLSAALMRIKREKNFPIYSTFLKLFLCLMSCHKVSLYALDSLHSSTVPSNQNGKRKIEREA